MALTLTDHINTLHQVVEGLSPSLVDYATGLVRKCRQEIMRSTWFVAQAESVCQSVNLPVALVPVIGLLSHCMWHVDEVSGFIKSLHRLPQAQLLRVLNLVVEKRYSYSEFAAFFASAEAVAYVEHANEWGRLMLLVALLKGKTVTESIWLLWDTRNASHKVQQLLDTP